MEHQVHSNESCYDWESRMIFDVPHQVALWCTTHHTEFLDEMRRNSKAWHFESKTKFSSWNLFLFFWGFQKKKPSLKHLKKWWSIQHQTHLRCLLQRNMCPKTLVMSIFQGVEALSKWKQMHLSRFERTFFLMPSTINCGVLNSFFCWAASINAPFQNSLSILWSVLVIMFLFLSSTIAGNNNLCIHIFVLSCMQKPLADPPDTNNIGGFLACFRECGRFLFAK